MNCTLIALFYINIMLTMMTPNHRLLIRTLPPNSKQPIPNPNHQNKIILTIIVFNSNRKYLSLFNLLAFAYINLDDFFHLLLGTICWGDVLAEGFWLGLEMGGMG
jgi:hypothetical protein